MQARAFGKLRILSRLEGTRKKVSYYIHKQGCHTTSTLFLTTCRKLCSNSAQLQCWKCGSEIQNSSLFCNLCSTLQKPDESKTYFDILCIKEGFEVKDEELTTKYRKLQSVLHPDRFSVKNAVSWSNLKRLKPCLILVLPYRVRLCYGRSADIDQFYGHFLVLHIRYPAL
jgi:hypothetical protein